MYSSIVRDRSGYLFCNTDNNIGQTKPLISVCLKHWLGRLIAACCCCRHHNASVRLQSSHHTPASQPLNDRHVGHGDHRSQPCLPTKMSPPISECRHGDMPAYCTLNTIMSDGERFQIPNFQLHSQNLEISDLEPIILMSIRICSLDYFHCIFTCVWVLLMSRLKISPSS